MEEWGIEVILNLAVGSAVLRASQSKELTRAVCEAFTPPVEMT